MRLNQPNIIHFDGPSAEARRLFAGAPKSTGKPIASLDVEQARADAEKAYAAPAQWSREQYCQSVTEERVDSIRYLRIVPKVLNAALQGKVGVYFFGGGFFTGSPELDLIVSAAIAQALGIVMLSPDYQLAPENPFPAGFDDCFAFYKSAETHYGADNIFLMGESAGANLAMATVLRAFDEGIALPTCVVAMSPATDQHSDAFAPDNLYQDDPALLPELVDYVGRIYAPNTPNNDPYVSPHFATYGEWFPPILFTTGTRDVFQFQVLKSAEKLAHANIDVTVHLWQGMWHVFEYYPEIPEAGRSIAQIATFVRAHV